MENRILKLCKDIVNKEEELTCNGINCKECPFEFTSKELCYACEEHRYNEGMEIAIRYIKEHSPIKEEIKTEKTFREVIADIKEGEVWETPHIRIYHVESNNNIVIEDKEGDKRFRFTMVSKVKFKLQKKEYTFQEAFIAYEEGKEIESVSSAKIYQKEKDFLFASYEISNKWYINN